MLSASVCQLLWNVKHPLAANRHHGKCFCPSLDDLVCVEVDGLATLVAAVKDSAVNEASFVVHLHLVGCLGNLAGTLGDNLVL